MGEVVAGVMRLLLRVVLVAAGLVFAASLMVAVLILAVLWLLRTLWAGLTGRRVTPFVLRIHPIREFERVYRRAGPASRTPRADATGNADDRASGVTDVEPKDSAR